MKFHYPPGATPLDRNEIEGLIPAYITTQRELNDAEQENIMKGELWAFKRAQKNALTDAFIKRLHKEMFGEVWKWAGTFRQSDKNIGVGWAMIRIELQKLLKDTAYWIENETYKWDELGARFHHRLVSIHCFSNGNGRHARTMTQVLLKNHDQELFTWGLRGKKKYYETDQIRRRYIEALQEADRKNVKNLIEFVRS